MWTEIKHYIFQSFFYVIGTFLQLRLRFLSNHTAEQQKCLLANILSENKNTKCVKQLKINCFGDFEEYRSTVQLTSYRDYYDLARDVTNTGSEDIMFPGKTDFLALTSGTITGESHMFPKKIDILKRKTGLWILLAQRYFLQIPDTNFIRKWFSISITPTLRLSTSGVQMGPISGIASALSVNMCMYVTPPEVIKHLTSESSAIYVHQLFGLLTTDIKNIFFPTATLALTFFKLLERNWTSICDAIELGELSEELDVDESIMPYINSYLEGGNASRAEFLRGEFQKGMKDIVPRIWPTCGGLFCAATGSYAVQAEYVKSEYLGHLRMFSPFHAGTESLYGMNIYLMEEEATYVAMTPYIFFEFIPENDLDKVNPETVLAHEVTVGSMYEMVVTTWEGLYRYRTGDVIQVTHLYGQIPRYKFIRRSDDVLSAGTERVPERFVSTAVQRAAKSWNRPVYDMTSVENIHVETLKGSVSERPFYIVFVQLHDRSAILTDDDKALVDMELCKLHEVYGALRVNEKMLPLCVVQLQYGALNTLKDLILDTNPNVSYAQYKLPRIIRREHLLRLLLDSEVVT